MADASRGIPDKEPKEKNAHTQRIAAERAIMEATGATRSQIRNAALGTPLRQFIEQFQKQPAVGAVVAAPPPPVIETVEQAFHPMPFTLGLDPSRVPPPAPPAEVPAIEVRAVQLQDDGSYLAGTATVGSFTPDA